MFLDQFASFFTREQKQTELYKIWSAIGVNTEKSLLEEQNRINAEMTDISTFNEDTLRSWLSFFLVKVPYRITSKTTLYINVDGTYSKITIPQYSQLKTDSGIIYTTLEEIELSGDNNNITTSAVQGTRIVETGIYSSLIKVQANNPDLSYLKVMINGKEIPEAGFTRSWDYLSYIGNWDPINEEGENYGGSPVLKDGMGVKGQWYSVGTDGDMKFSDNGLPIDFRQGDIVIYNGSRWQKLLSSNGLNPVQFSNNYIVPHNGYFAYYYNNYLYVKIYTGTEVEDPEGKQYVISYISSDGVQGEVEANTLQFISSFQDMDEQIVKLNVKNNKSTAAANQPTVGKLGIILKQRLYCNISLSSVPEYTMWFKAQPEVGDCIVLSDWERYQRFQPSAEQQYFVPTGEIQVYACDMNGNALTDSVQTELLTRIQPYKDIGLLQLYAFYTVKHAIRFTYTSSTQDQLFKQFVISRAGLFYSIAYLQGIDSSIFDDLDLAKLLQNILNDSPYGSVGLTVKGYHYVEETFTGTSFTHDTYSGEEMGDGFYIFTTVNGDTETTHKFTEFLKIDRSAADIVDEHGDIVGERSSLGVVTFGDLSRFGPYERATMKCYWGMKDEGILTVGKTAALRQLAEVIVEIEE